MEGGVVTTLARNTPIAVNGWNCVFSCNPGLLNGNRIGKRIFIRYITLRISVFQNVNILSTFDYEPIRITICGDKRANPDRNPANPASPYVRPYVSPTGVISAFRSPVDVTSGDFEWNNVPNTEDWNVLDDMLINFTPQKFVYHFKKTYRIMSILEFGDS